MEKNLANFNQKGYNGRYMGVEICDAHAKVIIRDILRGSGYLVSG